MEDGLKVIANFMSADDNVRNQLIDRLMSNGEIGMEDLSYELARNIAKRTGIELSPHEINRMISRPYAFGFERFMDEYDRGKPNEMSFMGRSSELDQAGLNIANGRKEEVFDKVENLSSNGKVNYCWYDFVNRGYDAIRDRVNDEYGRVGVARLEQCSQILKEQMEDGLKGSLNKTNEQTKERLAQLHVSTVEMNKYFYDNKLNERLIFDNASFFK